MHRRTLSPTLIAVLLLAGCAAEEPAEEAVVLETPSETAAAPQTVSYPDTTAEAVWSYLQAQSYAQEWQLWPGKQPYYEGVEPHGALLNTYLNPVAYDGLAGTQQMLPPRSIIVKENYMPDSTLAATTVMYRVPGYDAEHDDWWWLKRNADGTVEGAGRVQGCIGCHGGVSDNDYVLTGTLASGGREPTQAARAAKRGGGQ